MKKFYSIVLTACALLFSATIGATDVATLSELQAALTAGGNITLTADINAGANQLNVTKATTIDGAGFCIKGTDTYVIQVNTTGKVVMKNLVIYAARTSKAGRGILIDDNTNNADLTLNNVTINCTYRAMDVWYSDGVKLAINNCVFQNVQGQTVDAKGNPTAAQYDIELTGTNASDTRGLNFGQLTNSEITINNTVMQGFFYVLNNITGDNGDATGTKLVANNSTFKGRAALNVWGFGAEYEFNDCTVVGINNYGSAAEGFSCFVFNNQATCHDDKLTINGGTVVSAVFNSVGASNPNANQYMVDTRYNATNITIVINNAQYTCTKDLGNDKGGVIATSSPSANITINGGVYDCPNIIGGAYSKGGATGSVVINDGYFNVKVVSPDMTDGDMYSTVEINGGTYRLDNQEDILAADPNNPENDLIGNGVIDIDNLNGSTSIIPETTETEKITDNTDIEDDTEVDRVNIASGKELRVKTGKTLTVGEGGMVFGNNSGDEVSKLIVEPGATVFMKGVLYGAEASNVVIQADATNGNQGVMLIDPATVSYGAMHPEATFEIVSRAYNDGGKGVWQRFGIPSFTTITGMTTDAAGIETYVYDFDNAQNDWRQLGKFTGAADETLLAKMNNPFACYNMICSATAPGTRYTITGKLLGNDDAALNMYTQYNTFANSYSGKINMVQLLTEMYDNENVEVTVYAWKPAGNNSFAWEAVDLSNYDIPDELHQNIQPMQAFIILAPGANGNIALDYKEMVWNPAMGISSGAPARRALPAMNSKVQIVVADANNNSDNVILMEGDQFSAANDRGYDAAKYMNENLNLYVTADEKMAHVATDNLEGQFVGISCVEGGEFTMSFEHLNGETLVIRDLLTNATISMKEGETYTFTAENNSAMDYRFQVIGRANVATAVEEVEAAKTAGIYTLTGVYMGDVTMWNTLPQGVYVVNGEKKVK